MRAFPDVALDELRRFEEAGVDRIVLEVGAFADVDRRREDIEQLERFAERVLARR